MQFTEHGKRGGIVIKEYFGQIRKIKEWKEIQRVRTNIFLPLGAGLIISALLMNMAYSLAFDARVEKRARELGMIYPGEDKVIGMEQEETK